MADRYDFNVTIYHKDQVQENTEHGFILEDEDYSYRFTQMTRHIMNEIEQVVIRNGWFTIYTPVFALVSDKFTDKVKALIIYKPTFRYEVLKDKDTILHYMIVNKIKGIIF